MYLKPKKIKNCDTIVQYGKQNVLDSVFVYAHTYVFEENNSDSTAIDYVGVVMLKKVLVISCS